MGRALEVGGFNTYLGASNSFVELGLEDSVGWRGPPAGTKLDGETRREWICSYPFGGERVITNSCAQNYKFTGKERDAEPGNDDFGAGYYSSSLGRWLSPDSATTSP